MPESRVYGLFASLSARTGVSCEPPVERKRPFSNGLKEVGLGLGAIALDWMHAQDADCQALSTALPAPNASFGWFMEGGPSHLDLVDPKLLLNKLAGTPLPESFHPPITAIGEKGSPLLAAPRTWTQHGESGMWAPDWIAHIGSCMDEIAVIRSCWINGINHSGGVCQMNTCINVAGCPSLGAWIHHGRGSANDDLPAFVIMCDSSGRPVNGSRNWGSGFMPASHQGVRIRGSSQEPIANLNPPEGSSPQQQREKLSLLQEFNRTFSRQNPQQSELDARIASRELAFRMQAEAPEAVDLSQETTFTKALYGLDNKDTETFGKNCLLARRLVERSVRFVPLYHGTGSK